MNREIQPNRLIADPLHKTYADTTAMLADQTAQFSGYLYKAGASVYSYNGGTTGTLADYDAVGGGGSGAVWGGITGTLSDQTDLQDALNLKADADAVVETITAGTNIAVDNTDPQNPVVSTEDTLEVKQLNFDTTNTASAGEGEMNWNSDVGTIQIGMPGGNVNLQVGQEQVFKAKAIGSNILNGQLVYISGATGAVVEASLAQASNYMQGCSTIAMATENITQNQQGYFTTFGRVNDINTAGYTEGSKVYLSPTVAGGMTGTKPSAPNCVVEVGTITRESSTQGQILINIRIDKEDTSRDITKDPTGFTAPENIIITGNPTNRTVTLTGTVNGYYRGVPVPTLTSGYTSPAHSATTTTAYFLMYDGTSVAWHDVTTLGNDFYENLLIALAFYNSTDATWVYQRECHELMGWQTHQELHRTIGTYKQSGGGLANYVLSSTTAAERRPSVASTTIYDEDLKTTNPALAAAGNYTQFYLSGAGANANFITTATDIVPLSTNRPYYNQFTGGSWQQTLVSNNDYMNVWLVAIPMAADTNSQKLRYIWVQGQAKYGTLALALAETPNSVNLGTLNDLTPELVFIGKITIQYTGSNWRLSAVSSVDGTRFSQTTSPQGNYLSAVSTDSTLTGTGTPGDVLGINQATNYKVVQVSLNNSTALTTAAKGYVRIPVALNAKQLTGVAAMVKGASSSGDVVFTVKNGSTSMLSTNITIEAGEFDSTTATTQPVIDTSNNTVATTNQIEVAVSSAGTGVTYAAVQLTFSN